MPGDYISHLLVKLYNITARFLILYQTRLRSTVVQEKFIGKNFTIGLIWQKCIKENVFRYKVNEIHFAKNTYLEFIWNTFHRCHCCNTQGNSRQHSPLSNLVAPSMSSIARTHEYFLSFASKDKNTLQDERTMCTRYFSYYGS